MQFTTEIKMKYIAMIRDLLSVQTLPVRLKKMIRKKLKLWDGKGKTIFKVAATGDSSGLPNSIGDIKDFIGFDFLGDFEGIKEIDGWIIESIG
ncbi:hypothetical protein [Bacillus sp. BR3(2024)]|uniref:hypothetical protein n=1 Tax=Bacillus sp. BR3(2024) TaxID=3126755 RepID=UPI003183D1B1